MQTQNKCRSNKSFIGRIRKEMVNIMTWDELNKKYPEARYEMDNERERAFLKDCYSAYKTVGFADKFWSLLCL